MKKDKMIKWVVFDLDGNIGDTIPMCIEAFKDTVSPYCNDLLTEEEITGTFGLNEEGMIKKVVSHNDWQRALGDFYIRYQQIHTLCPGPFDGIKEFISGLKTRSVSVGLITGKGEKSCRITLKQFDMENSFDHIATGSPDKNIKAESLLHLLQEYNLHPDEVLYIGDTVSDIICCREAKIQCLSAAWAASAHLPQLQEQNKGYVFQTVHSLKEYIFDHI